MSSPQASGSGTSLPALARGLVTAAALTGLAALLCVLAAVQGSDGPFVRVAVAAALAAVLTGVSAVLARRALSGTPPRSRAVESVVALLAVVVLGLLVSGFWGALASTLLWLGVLLVGLDLYLTYALAQHVRPRSA